MALPRSAVFAFNANLDHVINADSDALGAVESFSPQIHSAMDECFSWGVQREIAITKKDCDFFMASMEMGQTIMGGQAGNAAEQASLLGVDCLLHSNYANSELCSRFSRLDKIHLASKSGFVPANSFSSDSQSAHHFVFEHPSTRTRFIASYDPSPLHLDSQFLSAIGSAITGVQKAFVSGFHLLKTPDRVQKFIDEVQRWKQANPGLKVFAEMGEFQSDEARQHVRNSLFPIVDMVGLNETELASFGCELEDMASEAKSVLFHTPEHSLVLPREKEDPASLAFAEKCASFLAANGRRGTLDEIDAYEKRFVDEPVRTVGLGDTFSCAYFLYS